MPKIGILKEGKVPVDRRVPMTPDQAKQIQEQYPDVQIVCMRSDIRCFVDDDYAKAGIELVDSVEDCDILFGVKEVPIEQLMDSKTYFFFSHTIKKQAYNRDLLRAVLKKNITLIDYETLTNTANQRIIAFGRYAGLVGAYNALWTFGKRYNLFDIRRAHECFDWDDLKTEFKQIKLPNIKIVITGGGRVAKGAMEVLNGIGIKRVSAYKFIHQEYSEPVYCQLNNRDYHQHSDGRAFSRAEFFANPQDFESTFMDFATSADVLIACAYWHPKAPVLFTREHMTQRDFSIKVIADVTCDIQGSIPSTVQPATISDPIYDYDPTQGKIAPPLSDEGNITVMAVDNLPCELPRNASEDFGYELVNNVIPHLIGEDREQVIARATLAKDGVLTPKYAYLQDYVDGQTTEG
ncbi:NAD(P)-dependent oxidoreductase [Reichenbachiella agarivorans]|uniref:Saccharopine dehydrogenase [NAD(+), L-lysine-forming] n=1 Tax=Reichenbachiella agarivorans TaxID=2979464 RepID=A0ABY6CRE1_9BACT|nr:NAD(P)-dependent oxidoreductase [Reichenbachiella agarivorans]UXP33086.1 NAD(P)-dependent oxidoreductase [Reichenbachiella agarivorans]